MVRRIVTTVLLAASFGGCSLFVSVDDLDNGVADAGVFDSSPTDSAFDAISPFDAAVDASDAGGPYLLVDPCVADDSDIVDMTATGPIDWVHWGGDADTKNISNHVIGPLMQSVAGNNDYSDDPRFMSWSDGTNAATVTDTSQGTYDNAGPVTLTVEASSEKRVLTIYLSTYSTAAEFAASLSPGVSSISQPLPGIVFDATRFRCTIHFASPSAAVVVVNYSMTNALDGGGGGNLALMGATVARDPN